MSAPDRPAAPDPGSVPERGMDRRSFLRRAATGAGFGLLAGVGGAASGSEEGGRRALGDRFSPPSTTTTATTAGPSGPPGPPVAAWVQSENSRPGTIDWVVTGVPAVIEGFTSQVSATAGEDVELFVNTEAPTFHVEAYRMGYYQGLGGRLVWQSDDVAGTRQPAPEVTPGVNTVSCRWTPSLTLNVDSSWPPGTYLLKLVGSGNEQQYVPFCVRDDSSTSAFLVQQSVTTWQAYNLWGGYSLYYGLQAGGLSYGQSSGAKNFAHRARIVSFDRPYPQDWAQGAADYIGLEFPLVYDLERLGLDVSYTTDVDVHRRPELLLLHRCFMSLGHDEYWSLEMRDGAAQARDAGVNLAFLGANACYRPIRFQPSEVGPDRLEVCYKSAAEDPDSRSDPAHATPITWASSPTSWSPSELLGATYCDIDADADMVVTDPGSWFWSGTGMSDGQVLPKAVHGEYDHYVAGAGPHNVEVLAHSPVPNRGPGRFSDMTWYTVPGGGGVFDSGSTAFVNKLADTQGVPAAVLPEAVAGVTEVLRRGMKNLYTLLGNGPAGATAPSVAKGGRAP